MTKYTLCAVPWFALGATIGWSASVCLWQAGHLRAPDAQPGMLLIVVGCMVLTAVFYARNHLEFMPRFVAYPFVFGGVAWFCCPQVSGIGLRFYREVFAVNVWFPCFVVPVGILGGIVAVVFSDLRQEDGQRSVNSAANAPQPQSGSPLGGSDSERVVD